MVPGSHPFPDERSVTAGAAVLERVGRLLQHESILLLQSGGGSSLLCAPAGVTLAEKSAVVSELMHAGARIHQLNTVRKHLSRIKGGRLAAATKASILNLVISDVPGDDVSTVASGIASPDTSTFVDALAVLDEFGLEAPAVRRHLLRGAGGEVPEGPGPDEPMWHRVESRIIGSNMVLLEAAKGFWQELGYSAVILSDRFEGDARDVARQHAQIVAAVRRRLAGAATEIVPHVSGAVRRGLSAAVSALESGSRGIVLLSGGESTVKVTGDGKGGRNQEFALWLLKELGASGVWAISVGSDGIDGNSTAAGALLTPETRERSAQLGLDVDGHLRRNDSYAFFHNLGYSVVTGHTGNNLNDYRAIVLPAESA